MQLLPELLCSVPAQVHTRLGEWWLAGYRQPSVNKDLWIPGPALLILVEPLGFFGRWILDEALDAHDSLSVQIYYGIPLGLRFCPVQLMCSP